MSSADIPLFSILKSRLTYLSQRQKIIAENVANTDTPGYAPRDLKPFALPAPLAAAAGGGALPLAPVQTNVAHLSIPGNESQNLTPDSTADSETRLDGNKVVLEEEMMKMTDARMNFDTVIGFYEKSNSLIELALRTPGKGA